MERERWIVALLIALLTVVFSIYTFSLRLAARSQMAAIAAFVFFFSIYLLLGIPQLIEKLRVRIGSSRLKVLGLAFVLLAAYSLYALSVARFRWSDVGTCALYLLIPAAALSVGRPKAEGLTIQDAVAILALWFPIEFKWLRLASVPVEHGQGLEKFIGLVWAVFLFLVVRRLDGVGYTFRLRIEDVKRAGAYFALFTAFFAIPLAVPTHFAASSATLKPVAQIIASLLGIAFLTALPEELLFRGLIHNLLAKRLKDRPRLALALSSLIFGLAHADNPNRPVWVYVVLATIAGWYYGLTYVRTGKVTAAAVTHWLVDSYWSIFFHG